MFITRFSISSCRFPWCSEYRKKEKGRPRTPSCRDSPDVLTYLSSARGHVLRPYVVGDRFFFLFFFSSTNQALTRRRRPAGRTGRRCIYATTRVNARVNAILPTVYGVRTPRDRFPRGGARGKGGWSEQTLPHPLTPREFYQTRAAFKRTWYRQLSTRRHSCRGTLTAHTVRGKFFYRHSSNRVNDTLRCARIIWFSRGIDVLLKHVPIRSQIVLGQVRSG